MTKIRSQFPQTPLNLTLREEQFIEKNAIYAQYGKDTEGLFNVQFLVEEEND